MTLKTKNPETVGGQFRGHLRGPALWEETAARSLSWIKDGGVREEKTPPLLDHSAIPREEERADAITGLSREAERTTRFRNSYAP